MLLVGSSAFLRPIVMTVIVPPLGITNKKMQPAFDLNQKKKHKATLLWCDFFLLLPMNTSDDDR